jgi:acid stress-induced BolA-like protein IbaG/YrbA
LAKQSKSSPKASPKSSKKVVRKRSAQAVDPAGKKKEDLPAGAVPPPQEDAERVFSQKEAEAYQEEFESSLSNNQRQAREKLQQEIYEEIKRGELHISQLKNMTVAELRKLAKSEEIEGLGAMVKQELIFAIIKNRISQNGLLYGEGVLEIMPDGYGFLRSPNFNYLQIGRASCRERV